MPHQWILAELLPPSTTRLFRCKRCGVSWQSAPHEYPDPEEGVCVTKGEE